MHLTVKTREQWHLLVYKGYCHIFQKWMMTRGLLKMLQSPAHQHMKGPACLAPVHNMAMCFSVSESFEAWIQAMVMEGYVWGKMLSDLKNILCSSSSLLF